MKIVRIYTGPDNESHFEVTQHDKFDYVEGNGMRTALEDAKRVQFAQRKVGTIDFHPAPRHQFMIYLTARVEIRVGDGSSVIMEPGDVLRAQDTTGRGHISNVLQEGMCAVVHLED